MFTKAKLTSGNMIFRDRDLSPPEGQSMWETCPLLAASSDMAVGFEHKEDFAPYRSGDWTVTQATTGAVVQGTLQGGSANLSAGAATSNQGVQMQLACLPCYLASGTLAFWECRINPLQLAMRFFAGLSAATTTLLSSGAIAAVNWLGFYSTLADGAVYFGSGKASVLATAVNVASLTAGTSIRLGFAYDGSATLTPYVNGVAGTAIGTASLNMPVVGLAPSFACLASGSGTPTIDLDYMRFFGGR